MLPPQAGRQDDDRRNYQFVFVTKKNQPITWLIKSYFTLCILSQQIEYCDYGVVYWVVTRMSIPHFAYFVRAWTLDFADYGYFAPRTRLRRNLEFDYFRHR